MLDTIEMSSDTTSVNMPKYKFERLLTDKIGGPMYSTSFSVNKLPGKIQFVLRTYPHTHITEEHVIGEWSSGRGKYCHSAIARFARQEYNAYINQRKKTYGPTKTNRVNNCWQSLTGD